MNYSCETCGKKYGKNRAKAQFHANKHANHSVIGRFIGSIQVNKEWGLFE